MNQFEKIHLLTSAAQDLRKTCEMITGVEIKLAMRAVARHLMPDEPIVVQQAAMTAVDRVIWNGTGAYQAAREEAVRIGIRQPRKRDARDVIAGGI